MLCAGQAEHTCSTSASSPVASPMSHTMAHHSNTRADIITAMQAMQQEQSLHPCNPSPQPQQNRAPSTRQPCSYLQLLVGLHHAGDLCGVDFRHGLAGGRARHAARHTWGSRALHGCHAWPWGAVSTRGPGRPHHARGTRRTSSHAVLHAHTTCGCASRGRGGGSDIVHMFLCW